MHFSKHVFSDENLRINILNLKPLQIIIRLTSILSEFQERPKKTCTFQNMFVSHANLIKNPVNPKHLKITIIVTSIPSLDGLGYIYIYQAGAFSFQNLSLSP